MPTTKLTKAIIDGLATPTNDAFYWDQKLPGFGLKISATGAKSYVIQYRDNRNRTKRLTLSTPSLMTLEAVKEEARRKLQAVRDGFDPALIRAERKAESLMKELLDEWRDQYLEPQLKGRGGYASAKVHLGHIRKIVGDLPATGITRKLLTEWHAKPEQLARPYAANGTIQRFRWIWSWLDSNDRLPATAPSWSKLFTRFPYHKERARERHLRDFEYQALARSIAHHREKGDINPKHVTLYDLLMVAGIRLSEGRTLRWDDGGRDDTNYIDEVTQFIVLQRHKTSDDFGPKYIPITPEIRIVLNRCAAFRIVGNPHLFPADKYKAKRGPMAYPDGAWRTLCETAGFKPKGKDDKRADVIPHDLRRSLITVGIETAGIPLESMAKTIGHADANTTRKHYHRLGAAKQRANMEKTTAALAAVIAG